jgi:hypothetical protein
MTAERSSEDNDGHQVRATIVSLADARCSADQSGVMSRFPEGLAPRTSILAIAGGYAGGAKASFDISGAATRPERWALRPASFARDSADHPMASSNRSLGSPRRPSRDRWCAQA